MMTPIPVARNRPSAAVIATRDRRACRRMVAPHCRTFLRQSIAFPSVSGSEGPFVQFIASWARGIGLDVICGSLMNAILARYPAIQRPVIFPLAGRPTLVLRLPGAGIGPIADLQCSQRCRRRTGARTLVG